MATKYIVQHIGRPIAAEPVTPDMWHTYKECASENAAWHAIDRATAHLSPGSWDDHYRVIAPDGHECDRWEFIYRQDADVRHGKQ